MECKCRLVDTDPFGQFKFCLKKFGSIILLEISKTVNMELSERESQKIHMESHGFCIEKKKMFSVCIPSCILYHRPL